MRKYYTIGLIAIHLMAHTEIGELLSMPHLLSHYFQHRQINPRLGFLTFLSEHYGGNDGTDADNDLDHKLPFHHTEHVALSSMCFMITQLTQEATPRTGEPLKQESSPVPDTPEQYIRIDLRPPRTV